MDLASVRIFAPRTRIGGREFKQFLAQKGYVKAQLAQDKRTIFLTPEISPIAAKLEGRNLYDFTAILRREGFRSYQTDVYEIGGKRIVVLSRNGTREEGLEKEEIMQRQASDEGSGNYRMHGGSEGYSARRTSIYNP